MENIEYKYLIQKELKGLKEKRIENIYEFDKGLRIKIGGRHLLIIPGIAMFLATRIPENIEGRQLIQMGKKHLKGKRITEIKQENEDRIISLLVDGGWSITCEMFAKGNVILTKEEEIMAVWKREEWKDRKIKPKERYVLPARRIRKDMKPITGERVIDFLLSLPLGKHYADHIVKKTKIWPRKKIEELSKGEVEKIMQEVKKIMNLENLQPIGFYDQGQNIDYGLIEFKGYENYKKKKFENLSTVLEESFHSIKEKSKEDKEIEKLKEVLKIQKKKIDEIKEEIIKNEKKAEWIYANYQEIEKLKRGEENKLKIKEKKGNRIVLRTE